jgi:signal transduction histidine kinase
VVDVFFYLKPAQNVPQRYEKQVLITNILSFLFFWVTLGIYFIFYSIFGWISSLPYILLVAVSFLFVPALNRWVSHRLGRVAFCTIPVWLTMAITIYFKVEDKAGITFIPYFDSRFILMAATILPGIVFRLEERRQLLICLGSTTAFMFLYDPIHELFGAGFHQRGFTDPSYGYINYITGVTYSVLLFGILLLRSVLERSETNLLGQNAELVEKQNEIEAQHEELLQHQEEMLTSSEKLEQANTVITKQREVLEKYNDTLEALVEEKSYELLRTNEELIKHNNELLQFSYTVSHNLRGPVARMLGLTRLLKRSQAVDEREGLADMILKSSEELDEILKDLSLIIDIRNDLYRVREKVFLQEEWDKAASMLGENVKSVYQLHVDFSAAPYVFGVRPMIQSIFYNLFSNAIKYQSPERKLKVDVRSIRIEENKTLISVVDNGLGIDLKGQQKNIFKLYKRFHTHVTGKGLGLYLVKTQLDTLGANVTVQSEPDKGAAFHMVFSQPEEVSRQVFYENDAVQLCYDGNRNIVIILWKRDSTSKEYREAFEAVLNSFNIYQTPGWISDIRNQGIVGAEDQQWFVENIVPELVKSGLKRTAIIGLDDPVRKEYHDRLRKTSINSGFELRVFDSMEESLNWMEDLLVASERS